MTPFDFPDLLGASWLDKAGPHSRLLHCQRKGDGKVGGIVDWQRNCGLDFFNIHLHAISWPFGLNSIICHRHR